MASTEKRSYPRRELFKHVTYEVGYTAQETEAVDAEIRNISRGGVCIAAVKAQDPGSIVMLMRPLKQSDFMVPSLAEVKWARRSNGGFTMGLKFIPGTGRAMIK